MGHLPKGPLERASVTARAETGGADQWVSTRKEFQGVANVNETKRPHPWDAHYQFSIKNSTLKDQ